jgi:DNA polymerase-3 subunit delta
LQAAKHYHLKSLVSIVSILRTYDMKVKGVGAGNMSEAELMREMIYKILHA